MKTTRPIQLLLLLLVAAVVALSVYAYWAIRERDRSLATVDRHHVTYSAYQAVGEYERFRSALILLERDRTPRRLNEARFRYHLLKRRIEVLGDSEFVRSTAGSVHRESISRLEAALDRKEPIMADGGTDLDVRPLMGTLEMFAWDITALASVARHHSASRARDDRASLSLLYGRFSTLTLGLIVCGFALAAMLGWHNRLLAQAHRRLSVMTRDLAKTAAELTDANEAVATANYELRRQNRRLLEKEQALNANNALFNAALNNMSQGLCMFDDDLRPLVYNTQFERLFHAAPWAESRDGAAADITLQDLIPELAAELAENTHRRQAAEFEAEIGHGRLVAVAQHPMPDGGWVATFADVTEERRTQARIAHMARHDGLTNLPNRYAFRERVQEAMTASYESGAMSAIIYLDLDNFKEVNDTLGHPAGDALLCAVAERLTHSVRDTDIVSRAGGDEFAVLQPCIDRLDDAERLASRLVDEIRRPFLIAGEPVYATSSAGIAVAPRDGRDAVVLQRSADLALYSAKASGRGAIRFFESHMDEQLAYRHVLERDLREAICNGQLHVHYQPVVELATARTVGFEALMRWTHPEHGAVPPSKFIPIAEETGLITEIGRWAFGQACAAAARWPAHIKLSVNLSAAQFTQSDIVEDIRAALSRAGLRPDRVIVEITESLLLAENITTLNALRRLKAMGIEVAMDDFGTGYSSLSYLRKYPFDRIKIDRAFVSALNSGEQAAAIVRTIVQLGAAFGMTTVAEGVETQDELDILLAAGCPQGQGYFFSKPVSACEVLDIIRGSQAVSTKAA